VCVYQLLSALVRRQHVFLTFELLYKIIVYRSANADVTTHLPTVGDGKVILQSVCLFHTHVASSKMVNLGILLLCY